MESTCVCDCGLRCYPAILREACILAEFLLNMMFLSVCSSSRSLNSTSFGTTYLQPSGTPNHNLRQVKAERSKRRGWKGQQCMVIKVILLDKTSSDSRDLVVQYYIDISRYDNIAFLFSWCNKYSLAA